MLDRRPALFALLLGLAVHGGLLYAFHHHKDAVDAWAFRSLDCHEYYDLGMNIRYQGVFAHEIGESYKAETWRMPGYPAYLALVMRMFDDTARSCVLMQHWLAVLNVLLFIGAAEPYIGGRRALLASAVFLVEPYHLFYSFWLISGILFTTGLLVVWMGWNFARRTGGVWRYGLCGLLAGGIILIRPIGVVVPLALAAAILIGSGQRGRVVRAVALMIMAAVGPVLWMARNHRETDHFGLSSQSGTVLAYFKASEVALWARGEADQRYIQTSLNPQWSDVPRPVWDDMDQKLQAAFAGEGDVTSLRWPNLAQGNNTRFDDFAVSAALGRIGRQTLVDNWKATLTCSLTRCGEILTFPLNRLLIDYAGTTSDDAANNASDKRQYLWLGTFYAAVCIIVLFQLLRCRTHLAGGLFPVMVTLALLAASTPQIDPRFRIPMIPMLVFLMFARKATPGAEEQATEPDEQPATDENQDAVSTA